MKYVDVVSGVKSILVICYSIKCRINWYQWTFY